MLRFLVRRPVNPSAHHVRHLCILNAPLAEMDPEVREIIDTEQSRQKESLVLIPSENFTSRSVMEASGSVMQNKYSEGYPGARYYGGNEHIDRAELLCQRRALSAFRLSPDEWGVNVQPLSGSPANMYVYSALLRPHDRIMGLDLPHGGHLSHGYQTDTRKVSAVSKFFETFAYGVDQETGLIDYEKLQELVGIVRPKLLIAGASSYPRLIDYEKMRKGSKPRRDVGETGNVGDLINKAVFPGHQGGPHNHTIAALAVALHQDYQQRVVDNCQALAARLLSQGVRLVSGGSDTHLLLLDLSRRGIDGARLERVLEMMNIAANKNTIPGDKSAMKPSGLRIGTPAMTTRGFDTTDFEWAADVLCEAIELTSRIQEQLPSKSMADFKTTLTYDAFPALASLRKKIVDYVTPFAFYS
ncbi:Serine hydroxymethyltransferase [Paramicrosporidium saccamoebae]|uniref:glycine hydroxymethyltransferase n=1 Tax=Paramicrosporidium saccamoebae TaxID=1246581 RepID=A0A2H9TLB9_9FUNG|nr:Serine hydroxymethyltransferase [Paramicrosporidium saccamoebae]